MGSIVRNPKKGGKPWKAQVSISNQGLRHRKTRVFTTKREAQKWVNQIELNVSNGATYMRANMHFVDWYWLWFKTYKERSVSPATKDTYRATYQHLKRILPLVTVEGLSRPLLQSYVNALDMSYESVRKDLCHIRTALRDAVADGVIPRSPADGQIKINADEDLTKGDECKFMPEHDYRKLRNWLEQQHHTIKHTNWFVIMVISQTALRVGEALALNEDDFDFDKNTIRVDESFDSIRGEIRCPKTKNANRTIPAPPALMKRIRIWMLEHRATMYNKNIEDDGYIMINGHGKLPKANCINKSYHQLQIKLGIPPKFSTHTLRHTIASLMIKDNTVAIAYVSKYLGHSSELITRKYYLGLIPEQVSIEQQKAVQAIVNA